METDSSILQSETGMYYSSMHSFTFCYMTFNVSKKCHKILKNFDFFKLIFTYLPIYDHITYIIIVDFTVDSRYLNLPNYVLDLIEK